MNTLYQLIIIAFVVFSSTTVHCEFLITDVQTTDITPFGFSVIWQTSEPATPGIAIFSDPQGLTEVTDNFEIIPFPLSGTHPETSNDNSEVKARAKALGLMKIQVHGCLPETTCYYKVFAHHENDIASWPENDFHMITTSKENAFISHSKQLFINFIDETNTFNTLGALIIASYSNTLCPVTAYAGDGTQSNEAYINLNHFFNLQGTNWTPQGTKEIQLSIKGIKSEPIDHPVVVDFSNHFFVSSMDSIDIYLSEAHLPGDIDNNGMIDINDAIIILNMLSGMTAGNASSQADINGDGIIAMEDLIYILNYIYQSIEKVNDAFWTDEHNTPIAELKINCIDRLIRLNAEIPPEKVLKSYHFILTYDATKIEIVNVIPSPDAVFPSEIINQVKGELTLMGSSPVGITGLATISLIDIEIKGIASGEMPFEITVERFENQESDAFLPKTHHLSIKVGPCEPRIYHSADYSPKDYEISLSELLRVIQIYNYRSGAYHCDENSEDGYRPGVGINYYCRYHTSDYSHKILHPGKTIEYVQPDWIIDIDELLRAIQIYNVQSTPQYDVDLSSEDGFKVIMGKFNDEH